MNRRQQMIALALFVVMFLLSIVPLDVTVIFAHLKAVDLLKFSISPVRAKVPGMT